MVLHLFLPPAELGLLEKVSINSVSTGQSEAHDAHGHLVLRQALLKPRLWGEETGISGAQKAGYGRAT